LKNVLKYNDRNIKCTAYNTRFAKSGNNCFNLKIIIKFEITAPFEDFGSKCRLRQAVEPLCAVLNNKIHFKIILKNHQKHLFYKKYYYFCREMYATN